MYAVAVSLIKARYHARHPVGHLHIHTRDVFETDATLSQVAARSVSEDARSRAFRGSDPVDKVIESLTEFSPNLEITHDNLGEEVLDGVGVGDIVAVRSRLAAWTLRRDRFVSASDDLDS